MIGVATKILKEVSKTGEISLDIALSMSNGKTQSHTDQYPLAMLLEEDYLGISIDNKPPKNIERMRELDTAIFLHMFTLPKNKDGEIHYMDIISRGGIVPNNERVFLKAKGALYLDEQRGKFRERLYSFVTGILVGIIVTGYSAWIHG